MKLHYFCTFTPTEQIPRLAKEAEALGFDGMTIGEHLLYPTEPVSPYPYTDDGSVPWDPQGDFPDPLATAAAVLAASDRFEVICSVYMLALRHPLFVAKAVATVDRLSGGGRFSLGVGLGWLQDEFDSVGVDFATRGRRTDESIEVMRKLWTGEVCEHHGEFFDFGPVISRPAPAAPIPILVGGASSAAIERTVRLGDGFLPFVEEDPTRCRELLTELQEASAADGRNHSLEVLGISTFISSVDQLFELQEMGMGGVGIDPMAVYPEVSHSAPTEMTLDERLAALEWCAETMVAKFKESPS